ncbi:MAG: hypothetical protein P8Z31_08495, partial [Gammaproteobacteria bacterium]
MKLRTIPIAAVVIAALTIVSVANAASFVIRDIRVEGLQRLSVGTVFNNIPYEVGQRVGDDAGAEIIRSLYATGLFKDVTLEQDGGILVVSVIERPAIASIDISGNRDIDTEQLLEAGVQVGWGTRLVPFSPDISGAVFALGFANRAGLA